MDYLFSGGVCVGIRPEDPCEGTSLLDPKANFAQWTHHSPPIPFIYASVPPHQFNWDDSPSEAPTPPSYASAPEIHPLQMMIPQMQFIPKDPKLNLARESAEYFGYILNYKRSMDLEIVEAKNLSGNNTNCIIHFGNFKAQTEIVPRTSHPQFNSKFHFTIRDHNDSDFIEIKVKNKTTFMSGLIGSCYINPSELHEEQVYDRWIELVKEDDKTSAGEIRVQFCIGSPSLDSVIFNVKQNGFTDNFEITEEFGQSLFSIENYDDEYHFIDRFDTRVFDVKKRDNSRRMFQVEPIFDILQAGTDRVLAQVSRKLNLLKVEFFLEIMGERVIVQREKWNSNITITREDGSFVAHMRKPTMANKNLCVEIAPMENVPLVLSLCSILNCEDTQIAD